LEGVCRRALVGLLRGLLGIRRCDLLRCGLLLGILLPRRLLPLGLRGLRLLLLLEVGSSGGGRPLVLLRGLTLLDRQGRTLHVVPDLK
jgi:hypothetical protein